MIASPYAGVSPEQWLDVTRTLVDEHPLKPAEIVEVTLGCWDAIFKSRIGGFVIGRHIKPKPQIMGFLLHELIPLAFAARYPTTWRPESVATEKDLVHVHNDLFSIEIKTSSNPTRIFGNRSYAQQDGVSKKEKTGYYLAVNCEKFGPAGRPKVTRIRFGWIDSADWRGQVAATGQQANLFLSGRARQVVDHLRRRKEERRLSKLMLLVLTKRSEPLDRHGAVVFA